MTDILKDVRDCVNSHRPPAPTRCPERGHEDAAFVCAVCKTPKENAPEWLKQIYEAEKQL